MKEPSSTNRLPSSRFPTTGKCLPLGPPSCAGSHSLNTDLIFPSPHGFVILQMACVDHPSEGTPSRRVCSKEVGRRAAMAISSKPLEGFLRVCSFSSTARFELTTFLFPASSQTIQTIQAPQLRHHTNYSPNLPDALQPHFHWTLRVQRMVSCTVHEATSALLARRVPGAH